MMSFITLYHSSTM